MKSSALGFCGQSLMEYALTVGFVSIVCVATLKLKRFVLTAHVFTCPYP